MDMSTKKKFTIEELEAQYNERKTEMDAIDQAIIIQTGLTDKFNTLNNIIADRDVYITKLKNKLNT